MLMQIKADEWNQIQGKVNEWRKRFEAMQAILQYQQQMGVQR
jgi:hypothetical protein